MLIRSKHTEVWLKPMISSLKCPDDGLDSNIVHSYSYNSSYSPSPPPASLTSYWWGSIWSRSVRPRSSRGLWPGSTQHSQSHITHTSGGRAGPRRPHWTHTAVAVEMHEIWMIKYGLIYHKNTEQSEETTGDLPSLLTAPCSGWEWDSVG